VKWCSFSNCRHNKWLMTLTSGDQDQLFSEKYWLQISRNSDSMFTSLSSTSIRLGLIHTRHFGTQYCDKKIKRYCNKKNFEPWISITSQGKLLTNLKLRYYMFCLELTLANRNQWLKNIFLLQYCPSKCLV